MKENKRHCFRLSKHIFPCKENAKIIPSGIRAVISQERVDPLQLRRKA